jgi:hypothetical protein
MAGFPPEYAVDLVVVGKLLGEGGEEFPLAAVATGRLPSVGLSSRRALYRW